MTAWVETNLQLLKERYQDLEARLEGEIQWIRVPVYPVSSDIWTVAATEVAFRIPANAGEMPYGFWVHPGLQLKAGGAIDRYTYPSATPWGADWGQFSYQPEDPWQPKADVRSGVNMRDFARGIGNRLREEA